ncbi:MAG: nuclease-related domain-containing protein [Luteolibacter sp.]
MTLQIDFTQILQPFIANWPWFLGLFILLILARFFGSAGFKGWFGERAVSKSLSRLDPEIYQTFHDLYLPRPDGKGTTQLDHVVVSPFGIFVIETKNYRGWIFGSEKQRQWTQQIYKRKERFQNPLHQNHLHIRALMDFLGLPESAFHSVIFFIGASTFKTPMPPNVLNKGLRPWIETRRDPILSPVQVVRIREVLDKHEHHTDRKAAARDHLRAMRKRT